MIKRREVRGLSTIVATLLVILLTMVAVGIVWVVVKNVLQSGSEQISLGKLTLDLEIKNVAVNPSTPDAIDVRVKRNPGDGDLYGLRFIISDGENSEVVEVKNLSLEQLEEKTFTLTLTSMESSEIDTISIAPMFMLDSGKVTGGDIKNNYNVSKKSKSGTSTGCTTNAQCADVDSCTVDICSSGTCVHNSIILCTDGDSCCPSGCDYTNDNNCAQCTTANQATNCNDANACTDDICSGNICTNPVIPGCCTAHSQCVDGILCTSDFCFGNVCSNPIITTCCNTALDCSDGDACTTDTCGSGNICSHTPITCNDANSCTTDICSSGSCVYTPIACSDGNLCTTDICSSGSCVYTPITCSDSNLCTTDICSSGSCSYIPIACSDGNLCTTDICSSGSCVYTPITCSDSNLCTTDICSSGSCSYIPITCNDANACTTDSCSGGTCNYNPINCGDGNSCTTDICSGGTCSHSTIVCNDLKECTSDSCSGGLCVYNPLTGNACTSDANACTTDICSSSGNCNHNNIIVCADGDGCCPPGCNSINDNNCVVSCGNNLIESGEICDGTNFGSRTCETELSAGYTGTLTCNSCTSIGLSGCSLSGANTYYISPSGSDTTGTGSISLPWRTLYKACNRVTTSGSIIHVNAGTYTETQPCNLAVGVSIEGEGYNSVILSRISTTWQATIVLSSISEGTNGNQHISHIKMDGNNLEAYRAITISKRSNVHIYNSEFVNFYASGILFSDGDSISTFSTGNKFYNNRVSNCATYYPGDYGDGAVGFDGQIGFQLYNNTISQVGRATGYNGWPVKYGGNAGNKGTKIYNNTFIKEPYDGITWDFAVELSRETGIEIYNNTIIGALDINFISKGTYDYGAYIHHNILGPTSTRSREEHGMYFEFGVENLIVENNYFKNLGTQISFTPRDGSVLNNIRISYNIFDNIGYTGGNGDGITFSSTSYTSNNFSIYNNIFRSNSAYPPYWGINFPKGTSSTLVNIKNNIIIGFTGAAIVGGDVRMVDGFNIQNNLMYNNGNSNDPYFITGPPVNYVYSGTIKSNPLFVSTSDLHLQSGSPAINAGLNVGLTRDYDGKSIIGIPDIGAYETSYSSFANVAPPQWPANIYVDITATLTEATYTLTPDIVYHDFYKNSDTTPYRIGNTGLLHTPRSTEGIVAGDSLRIVARAVYDGVEYPGVSSTAKIVGVTPSPLTASTQVSNIIWTLGSPTVPVIPVSATGGTLPYHFSVSPVLPSPLQMNSATGQIGSGTVSSLSSQKTYTVTVTDSAAMPASVQSTFTGEVSNNVVEPLQQIPYELAYATIDGCVTSCTAYDGINSLTWNGNVMLGPVLDPDGSGLTVNIHRIIEDAPPAYDISHRSELTWHGYSQYDLPPGVDTWQSFAIMRKINENLPESTLQDPIIVFQCHSPEPGDTGAPYSLTVGRQGVDRAEWVVTYNTHPPEDWEFNGGPYPTVEDGWNTVHSEALMPEGEWYRYIVHYRAGYLIEHNPLLEVWRAKPGQPYEFLFSHTGFNAYNGGNGYPRIGPYRYYNNWNGQDSIAFYYTPLYFGKGADLYDEAVAALEGIN